MVEVVRSVPWMWLEPGTNFKISIEETNKMMNYLFTFVIKILNLSA